VFVTPQHIVAKILPAPAHPNRGLKKNNARMAGVVEAIDGR
jgi:hypothetical protein